MCKQTIGEVRAASACKAECFQLTPDGFPICFQKAGSGRAEIERQLNTASEKYNRFRVGLTADLCLCAATAALLASWGSAVSTET